MTDPVALAVQLPLQLDAVSHHGRRFEDEALALVVLGDHAKPAHVGGRFVDHRVGCQLHDIRQFPTGRTLGVLMQEVASLAHLVRV